jgi:hypothetical protein
MSRHSKHPRYTYTKGNIYYFSRSVPADLRCFYLKPRITQSLRTNSQSRATTASKVFASKLDDYWLGLRLKRLDVPAAHLLVVDPSTKLSSLPTIEEALKPILLSSAKVGRNYSSQQLSATLLIWLSVLAISR